MDEKKPTTGNVPPPEAQSDAEQFTTWMTEYGRPALIGLAVAVVVLLGLSIWRNQKQEKADAAVQALFQGRAPEEFRQMAVADPKAPTAPVALATAAAEFYAQGRYDEALSTYQSFLAQYPGHMLEPDAQLGVAASLEALDDFEAAAESYEAFAASHVTSTLAPQAVMGAARSREQLGQFDDARALYEDFIAANPESSWLPQAESGLLFLKKAERAKDLPSPVVVPAVEAEAAAPTVVFDSNLESAFAQEEVADMSADSSAVANEVAEVVSEQVQPEPAIAPMVEPKADAPQEVVADADEIAEVAPVVEDTPPAVAKESKPKKRKSPKKKTATEAPVEPAAAAEEPAAE